MENGWGGEIKLTLPDSLLKDRKHPHALPNLRHSPRLTLIFLRLRRLSSLLLPRRALRLLRRRLRLPRLSLRPRPRPSPRLPRLNDVSLLAPRHLLGFRSLGLPLELRFLRVRVLGGEMQTLACFSLDLHGLGLLHRARDLRGGELRAGTCHACCELGGGAGSGGFAFCAGFGARDGFGGGAGVEEGAGGGEGRETEEEDVFDEHGGTGPE